MTARNRSTTARSGFGASDMTLIGHQYRRSVDFIPGGISTAVAR
jgi:hypothetical protein